MRKSEPAGNQSGKSSPIQQSIFQNANVLLMVLDPRGRILDWNTAAEEMSGYTAEEVVGNDRIWKYLYPDAAYRKTITGTITRVIRENQVFENFETVIRTKSGGQKTISWNTRAIPDGHGGSSGFVAIGIDVSARKKLEEELISVAHEWESTFNATSDGICLIGADQKIQRCNRTMSEILGGVPQETLIGRSCFEIIHETTGPIPTCPFVTAKETLRRTSAEVYQDGHWYEVTADPILDSSGVFTGAVHIMRDITLRKSAEEALQESEEKFRRIFDMINDGIQIHEIQADGKPGKFIEVNEVACRMLQYTREELLELGPLDFVTGYHSRPLEEITGELLSTGHAIFETEHRRKDGTIIPVEINTHVVSLHARRMVVSTVRDITARKRVEEALRQNRLQLANAMDLSHIVNWEFDVADGMFTFDDRFYSLFGTTAEREGGHRMSAEIYAREFVHPDDIPGVGEEIRKLLATRDPNYRGQMEHRIIRRDGEIRTIIARYAPVMDAQGKVIRTFGANQDITERKRIEDALRNSEQILEGILNAIPVRVFWKDKELNYLGCNTSFARDAGFEKPEEIIGRDDYSMGWRDQAELYRADDRKVIESGIPKFMIEEPQTTPAGETIYLLTSKLPLFDARGDAIGILGTYLDITERKRAEEALRESRQIFADIISFLPDPTFVIDAGGRVLAWNRAIENISGVTSADIVGKGNFEYSLWQYGKRRPILIDLVQNPDKDYGRVGYRGILLEGHTIMAETDFIHAEKKITLSLVASPLLDQEGKIIGAIESMRDITRIKETEAELAHINVHLESLVKERTHALEVEVAQRRNAEQKVRDTLRHTRNVIEANPDLMVVLDGNGIITDVNAVAEQMTGLPRDTLVGTAYVTYLVDSHSASDNFARLLREGILNDIPYEVRHIDGRTTPILTNARVQRNEAGAVEYVIASGHDITRQKKDAEAIKASLEEKIILLREVHHRVKNNLQIIISLNNLQLREVQDPKLKQFLNETKNRVRAMSLVHEKLYQSDSLSHIDLAEYLRYLASQLFSYYSTDSRRVKLVVDMGKAAIDINTAIPIGLIVNELISNALKYAFPGDREGTLVVSGGLEGQLLTISVKDDGIGMPPGYDWKNAKSLGLRLVNILADQIDGTVAMTGDQGTTFIITVRLKP
jgi:PAS domain S-box-containing protein